MGATQLGALAFLLLCARLWPHHRAVALTTLSWRVGACAAGSLVLTVALGALLLEPAGTAYLQWLAGATLAAAAALLAGARPGHAAAIAVDEALPDQARRKQAPGDFALCFGASLVVLAVALPDPFALARAADSLRGPAGLGVLAAGFGTLVVLLLALAAFGGLCNRAHSAGSGPLTDAQRLLVVAVLALPIAGLAPLLEAG